MEVGLGIHGEPGSKKVAPVPVKQLVQDMLKDMLKRGEEKSGTSVFRNPSHGFGLLINNLGAVPAIEMQVIANEAVQFLQGGMTTGGVPASLRGK